MKLHHRFLALLLVLLLLPAVPVQASNSSSLSEIEHFLIGCYTLENEAAGAGVSQEPGTVVGADVPTDSLYFTEDTLEAVFFDLRDSGRLPWYAASIYAYTYEEDTSRVTSFTPYYLDPQLYDRAAYEKQVAQILRSTIHDDMDQWQAALSLHDYLITHFQYDETDVCHRGYDLLVGGSAVCEGYAEAYMDLMNRAGIPCRMVSSDAMEHGWNMVCLYGNWYHVDLTWDDPTPDVEGYVSHEYFLLTDEQLASHPEDPHYGWKTNITCTDTTYAEAFWVDVVGAINYPNGNTSYFHETDPDDTRNTYILSREELTGETTVLYTEAPVYIAFDAEYETHCMEYGITLWNGRLYTATMDSVYSMKPDGSDMRTEFTYDAAGNGNYILGCFVDQGTIFLTLSDLEDNYTSMEVPLDPAMQEEYHIHTYHTSTVSPTCTENGYTEYSCSCGIQVTENIVLAAGHTYDTGKVIREATTSQTGAREFSCLFCDEAYVEEIPALKKGFDLSAVTDFIVDVLSVPAVIILICRILFKALRRKRKSRE